MRPSLSKQICLGVDGAAGGWAVFSPATGVMLVAELAELVDRFENHVFYIDIPIGLPDQRTRQLDRLARRRLPGRASSVFPVPGRAAVYAPDYETACRLNYQYHGRKISLQAWYICPRIREADQLLLKSRPLRQRLFECHPEIAFATLAGAPMQYSKKTRSGIDERLSVLRRWIPGAPDYYEQALHLYKRRELARDDAIDAMVLYLVGQLPQEQLRDGVDEYGIPLRMVLPATDTHE